MRLTNNTLLRGYNRSLNRLKTAKNDCENKITSQRKFARASEAPLSAAKALNVRKSMYYSDQHKENLKVAASFYTEAETSLLQVSSKMAEVRETLIAAVNTTKDETEYKIYANQLETMARELCSIFNTDSAGRSIFGGESDDAMPFTIIDDSNGFASTVLYHGVPVNSMTDYNNFPYSNRVYVDVGLGMKTDQESHVTNPMSVLDISFNGAEITGCGAESSIADIDLSSIQSGRLYVLDVYCDSNKKTITFKGQGTPEDNITMINELFKEAYKKDIAYGKNYPVMDEQGMVYSVKKDKDGNEVPVVGGLVSITNNHDITSINRKNVNAGFDRINTTKDIEATLNARTEDLVIDNDSGFTNKFRLNFEALKDGEEYKLDVKYGDVTFPVEFTASDDEDTTIKNFQEALDKVFGKDAITVSTKDPVKGIVSAEGKQVELMIGMSQADADRSQGLDTAKLGRVDLKIVDGNPKINLSALQFFDEKEAKATKEQKLKINGKEISIEVKSNDSIDTIIGYINEKINGDNLVCGKDGYVKDNKGNGDPVKVEPGDGMSKSFVTTDKTYQIDPKSIEKDNNYRLKLVNGNRVETIDIKGTGNGEQDLKDALGKNYKFDEETGTITAKDGTPVLIANDVDVSKRAIVERQKIYSNNYIQLTLDAARALRAGDIDYANGCIDRIVEASEHLLLEIADLGCNEDFIDFNIERIDTRMLNLDERQNDLEAADPEYMITLWKQYEAYFNACLQMSSTVIPNSIFNYMR